MPALSDQGQMVDLTDIVYEGHQGDAARDFPADAYESPVTPISAVLHIRPRPTARTS